MGGYKGLGFNRLHSWVKLISTHLKQEVIIDKSLETFDLATDFH